MFLYLLNGVHLYDCVLKQEYLQEHLKLLWQLEGSWQWSNPEWSSECIYDISNIYIFLDLKMIILITMPKVPALRVSHVKMYVQCTCTCTLYSVEQLPLHNPRLCLCVFSWATFRASSELSYHHIPPQMRSEISPLGMKRANARGRIGGNWSISATPPNLSQRLHSSTDQIIFHYKN